MYYIYGKEFIKKDYLTNIMIIYYKISNGSKADTIADTPDDTMSALAPPPKYIIIINLIIKYEPACRT